MSITHRVKRLLGVSLAGAMVLALMPAGIAAADGHEDGESDGVEACEGSEGLVEFNDSLGFFESEIECMAAFGITVGDADGNYNSTGTVTRQQMALFIARLASQALNGDIDSIPESEDDAFDDIADINPPEARDAINWLAELLVTEGTEGGDSYNPSGDVTRQQMASFIARGHVALGVDFDGIEVDDERFTDVDADNVHLDNINLLAAAGVVEGTGDGTTYSPANPVTRGQMSAFIVRSIGVLESQGLWNGQFVVEGDALVFTVVEDWADAANTTDGRDDLAAGENLIALSDGDAVTLFQFSVPEDDFNIDGTPATPTAFLNEVVVGATLVATPTATGFSHDISAPETVLEGTVGNGTNADTSLAIVDAPSGVIFTEITAAIALGQLYTVDGAPVNQATFLDNISIGDSLEAEVLSTDDDGNPESFRHNLTNDTLEGTVVVATQAEFEEAIEFGLTVGEAVAYDEDTDTISIVPALATPDLPIDDVTATTFDLVTADGLVIVNVSTGLTFLNEDGDATVDRYFVNDVEVTQAVYEDYLTDIAADVDTDGDSFSAVVTDIATQHRLTTDNVL